MLTVCELNHVALHVADVERSCRFYRDVLRLEPMPRPAFNFPGAWFRLGTRQELHLIGNRSDTVHSSHRGNHFALRVEDLAAWEEHFRGLDVTFRGQQPRPDGVMQVFLADPDGHVIELFSPAC
jgi:lactoylglutathione lyase